MKLSFRAADNVLLNFMTSLRTTTIYSSIFIQNFEIILQLGPKRVHLDANRANDEATKMKTLSKPMNFLVRPLYIM
jgi:hypothetical protein